MMNHIGTSDLAAMLAESARNLREQREVLSQLDCVAGDGDHGTTMLRVAEQLEAAVKEASSQSLAAMLKNCASKVLGVDGGASSALLGTFLKGMSEAADDGEPDCNQVAGMFESGMNAMLKQTKARPGDKTMVDALAPAVEALRKAAAQGKSVAAALEDADDAARAGVEATKTMSARYGRARLLGNKTLGHADAGATSIALIFHGFSQALEARQEMDHGRH